jgi:flagellar hook-associated protein 1 FlgK
MSGLLATSLSGLMSAQRSMEIAQHNISNANTEGYSRQRVQLGTKTPDFTGDGYIGRGVNVVNITRSYDQFINKQLSSSISAFEEADQYSQLAAHVDNIMADPSTGMAPVMSRFFNAVSAVASDPSSIAARQVMLSDANALTQNFNMIGGKFEEIRTLNNNDIGAMVNDINSFATAIADINIQVISDLAKTQGFRKPNDLLDQRDALISKLSELVNVSVVDQQDGSISVFIGSGQALVLRGQTLTLTSFQSELDPGRKLVGINTDNGNADISDQMTGGKLGGALSFREEVLDPAQQKLGQLAAGLAMEFNAVHKNGFDLNGTAGSDLFSFSGTVIPVTAAAANTGGAVVTASFQDVNTNSAAAGNLDFSDFRLEYVGASGDDYTLTRIRDNQVINLTAVPTAVAGEYSLTFAAVQPANIEVSDLPGIDITVNLSGGVILAGDQFVARPTYSAAQKIRVNITDPKKIAAATNIEVDPVTKQPVQQYDASNNPVVDAEGNPVYVKIKGAMPGDNRNALQLAALENKTAMIGGTAAFKGAYGQIVSDVGTLTRAANLSSSAQETLLNQAKASREGLAGVNLDEEAANLIKFQQAYQASAQSVSVVRSLFDTLISAVR